MRRVVDHSVPVLVVDDQAGFRQAAIALVTAIEGFEVIGEADTGEAAVQQASTGAGPLLVLMDITMPTVNGFTATRIIKQHLPQTQILVISQFNSPAFVRESLAAGASGFLSKENVARDLIAEIRRIQRPPRQSGSGPAQI